MAFSNENGQIEEELSYDAWGRRRSPSTWEPFTFSDDDTSDYDQGFTGHEHIDLFDMVNMDGRMYDPVVGRFLSPDPYIQMPDFTQSLNRYAYCINNPLSLTDPTGYNWLGDVFATVVGIAVGIETGGLGAGIYGAIIGGTLGGASAALVGSVLNGANLWQTTKNVFVGAFWGAAGGAMNFEIGELRNVFARIAVHSVSEGFVEGIQGGHFEHGLLMGLTSSTGGELISRYGSNLPYAGQIAANATLGGLVSELGGGKFANGAMTAAYTMMFNDLMHQDGDDKEYKSIKKDNDKENQLSVSGTCLAAGCVLLGDDVTVVGIFDDPLGLFLCGASVIIGAVEYGPEIINAGKSLFNSIKNSVKTYSDHSTNRNRANYDKHTKTRSGKTYGENRNNNRGNRNKKHTHPVNPNKRRR